MRGAYIATVGLTHAFHTRTTLFSVSTSAVLYGAREQKGGRGGGRTRRLMAEREISLVRWGGRGVMSIIGFNIGALGKPVYKYPYATVITT